MPEITHPKLPFAEAIQAFRQKLALPTQAWTDLREGMHARAFVVAGVTRQDVLSDLQAAVLKAIEQGTTLAEFRKDFERACLGKWTPQQDLGWRTRVIYETNIRTAYAAGRYAQLQDLKATHPFWEYRHGDSQVPRPEHLAWDGLVLLADDPWWKSHFCPNGWGCRCSIVGRDKADLKRQGKDGPDQAPPVDLQDKPWGSTGTTIPTPRGVDPGWGYSVGEATWGRPIAEAEMAAWRGMGQKAWERLTPGDWQSYGRPERLEPSGPAPALLPRAANTREAQATLEGLLGGPEKVFTVQAGDWEIPLLVDAQVLAQHLDDLGRSAFLGGLPDLLNNPDEVWMGFQRHLGTGKVVLRARVLKAVQMDGKRLVMVADVGEQGMLQAWTFLPTGKDGYIQNQRWGMLLTP